jgi:hypothetical protein
VNSNCRIAAMLYSLETCFFFRRISVNTLHNGEDDDGDEDDNCSHRMAAAPYTPDI